MKFNSIILLVACLSGWLTPAVSTGPLGAKIAAGVKGAAMFGSDVLAVKANILKGIGSLLEEKGSVVKNLGNAVDDSVQKSPATTEKPNHVTREHGKAPVPTSIQLRPVNLRTIEYRPMEIYSVRLVPLVEIPMQIYGTEEIPLARHFIDKEPVKEKPTETPSVHARLYEFKKNSLHGIFKTIQDAVVNKKKAIAGLMKH